MVAHQVLDPFAAVTIFKNHPSRLDATANGATSAPTGQGATDRCYEIVEG